MTLPTMLICDDETDLVSELAEWFGTQGWTVRTAHSANEALQLMSNGSRTTCLVTDRWMPDADGDDLLRDIEALPKSERPDLVAMMTGDFAIGEQPRPIGADLMFVKPVDPAEMLRAIAAQLSDRFGADARAAGGGPTQ